MIVPSPSNVVPRHAGRITGITLADLDLGATLRSGQVFRWKQNEHGQWRGAVGPRLMRLEQTQTGDVLWETDGADFADAENTTRSFLRIDDADLPALAREWCLSDALFARAWEAQKGVRILRQDPDECFFSFLCASVAPIMRISQMLDAVAKEWGTVLSDGETLAFPRAARLSHANEADLKAKGLGFRAKRVVNAARVLCQLPPSHLADLRANAAHEEAKRELTAFFGVGEKIADCVCLFALDKNGAVPVDVHIWRIAQTVYAPDLAEKSLTPANYARAVSAFHARFGPFAGWAQQILFYRAAVSRVRPAAE